MISFSEGGGSRIVDLQAFASECGDYGINLLVLHFDSYLGLGKF